MRKIILKIALVFCAACPSMAVAQRYYCDTFRGADWNSNGQLDWGEFQNWGYGQGMNGMEISNMFQGYDQNSDGNVSGDEWASGYGST